MKIIITGSRGFVGNETVKLLEEKGHTVFHYDVLDGYDIRDFGQLHTTFQEVDPDRVLHLAAIARFDEAEADPVTCFETNYIGTKNVVDACEALHIPLVHASTGSTYMPIKEEGAIKETLPIMGNSVYGCTKAAAELYVQQSKAPWIALRYAHLYGAEKRWHGLIGGFLKRIEHDMEPELYGGQQSNDFCYVKDVAKANLIALTAPWDVWNNAYNIGTGEELTAEAAGKIICDVAGYVGGIKIKPQRMVDANRFFYDMSKSNQRLGFKADFNFKDGLTDMFKEMQWVKK
jgi:UDP-glucose 4-epimerase